MNTNTAENRKSFFRTCFKAVVLLWLDCSSQQYHVAKILIAPKTKPSCRVVCTQARQLEKRHFQRMFTRHINEKIKVVKATRRQNSLNRIEPTAGSLDFRLAFRGTNLNPTLRKNTVLVNPETFSSVIGHNCRTCSNSRLITLFSRMKPRVSYTNYVANSIARVTSIICDFWAFVQR